MIESPVAGAHIDLAGRPALGHSHERTIVEHPAEGWLHLVADAAARRLSTDDEERCRPASC